jgi:hypothetical protein
MWDFAKSEERLLANWARLYTKANYQKAVDSWNSIPDETKGLLLLGF